MEEEAGFLESGSRRRAPVVAKEGKEAIGKRGNVLSEDESCVHFDALSS